MPPGRFRVKPTPPVKPFHVKATPPHRPPALAQREGGIVHAPVAREAGIGQQPSSAQRKRDFISAYNRLQYQREIARRHGRGDLIAKYDRKLTGLHQHALQAGFLPTTHIPKAIKITEQGVGDLGSAAYNAPGAAVVTGKSVGQDVGATTYGDFSFKHSRALAKAIALSTAQDFRHPLRHPGFTALDLFAIASAGAGTASRLGSAGKALSEGAGVRGAVARPGYEGGSLLHRKPPGELDLPGGVQALEHDNPLLNVAPVVGKRARIRRVNQAIESGRRQAVPLPRGLGGKHFTAESLVGREARAREQVLSDVANARRVPAAAASEKLTPAEHDAIRTVYVEGRHAFRHPEETISRHVATHERWAAEQEARANHLEGMLNKRLASGKPLKEGTQARLTSRINRERAASEFNRQVAHDLPAALNVLKDGRPEFHEALKTGRKLQHAEEQALKREGHLSGHAAYTSRATLAHAYGRAEGVAPKGSTYFPIGEQFTYPVRSVKGGPVSRVASSLGIGKPQSSRYLMGTMRRRTGAAAERGVVERPMQAQMTRAAGHARLQSVQRSFQFLKGRSTPYAQSERDIVIRNNLTPEIRQEVAREAEHAANGDATALGRIRDLLKPLPHEGRRYVNPDYIKEFATSAHGIPAFAKINAPFRFGGVYARPAYVVTNRPQNFLMRHLAQGSMKAKSIAHTSSGIRRALGPDGSAFVDGMGGESKTESFNPSHGIGGWVGDKERRITQFVMERTDKNERFLAVMARGWQKGIRTERDWADLRSAYERGEPQAVNKVVAISRRARKDMVDFAVTPGERTLSDLIYFYPWLSRGSIWAGRFLAEHPVKSAVVAQLGQESQREGIGIPGPHPAWMKGMVSTRLGIVNPNPLNSFSTPAQIVDALKDPAKARSIGEEFGTPATAAITSQPKDLPRRVIGSLAPLSVAQRFGAIGQPSKTFPQTGIGPALGPFFAGGLYPKRADSAAVLKQAYKEMSPPQAFGHKMKDLGKTFSEATGGKLPPELTQQMQLHSARYGAYKQAGIKTTDADYQQKALAVDLGLMVKMGVISTAIRGRWLRAAQTMSKEQISKQRTQITKEFFPSDWLNKTAKALGETVPR